MSITFTALKCTIKKKASFSAPKLPSLRNKQDENDQFNSLQVTPAFREYVAKQLSAILEKELAESLIEFPDCDFKQNKRKSRVKLFKNSVSYLKVPKTSESQQSVAGVARKPIRKRKIIDEDEPLSDDEENKIKTVAVSSKQILNKEDTRFWSNRSKAPVFSYKKSPTGELNSIEPERCVFK